MKNSIYYLAIFILFALIFSGLSGCGGKSGEQGGVNSNAADGKDPGKGSEYPMLAEKAYSADLKNLDGSTFKVSDKKGKVVLLNLWATWCGPCRAEMPTLVKLQDENRDKGFEIIGLNTDDGDTKEMIESFSAEMKLNYTLVWADSSMQAALLKISSFPGIPQSFLIDREGRLRGVFKGGGAPELNKLHELVQQVVNE